MNKITFTDLSLANKIAIIGGWIAVLSFAWGFLIGLLLY